MNIFLPIADPLEAEEFHGGAGAYFICPVIEHLYKIFVFFAAGLPYGLWFWKILHVEVRVLLVAGMMSATLLRSFHEGFSCCKGSRFKNHLCCCATIHEFGSGIEIFPKFYKQAVLLLIAIACA